MSSWFKHLLFFSRAQQIALVVLMLVLLTAIIATRLVMKPQQHAEPHTDTLIIAQLQAFQASLLTYDSLSKHAAPWWQSKQRGATLPTPVLQPFDPNQADSAMLVSLGIKPWIASNMIKYRQKGGTYKSVEAMERIYGMTPELFITLAPYVVIDSTLFAPLPTSNLLAQPDLLIDLNHADTATLKQLKGIGPVLGSRIVNYRKQLGGFSNYNQLLEIQGIDTNLYCQLLPHFTITYDSLRPIRINRASLERLRAHPYIDFYQAKAIYEYRRKMRYLDSLPQLRAVEELSPEWFEKMKPYLDFSIPQK